ncbi:5-oxoprolinase [Ophiostoma piceae UAMH 11346]|uniref:5-oxoprolinase n=1 Tax=Ophiostoma piceae (strain UAMH 11346) TaxID=1262450 RepID=S3CK86_OPHP1|nr:5-oxoprolinase [Ophiostoma piceae UAMH 11346]
MVPHATDEFNAASSGPVDESKLNVKIAIDRGGTFTDCLGIVEGRDEDVVVKLLSQDPANYADAPIEGIRRLLEKITGRPFPRGTKLDTSGFESFSIRMGTTVATNALLERKGADVALVITEGFRDALEIGLQSRPKLFDLQVTKAEILYKYVIEVEERVTVEGHEVSHNYDAELAAIEKQIGTDPALVRGSGGQIIRILKPLNAERVRADLQKAYDAGLRGVSVCLAHSYTYQDHEKVIGGVAADIGFTQISLSSATLPMIKMIPRGMSATADAYLTPKVKDYISGFRSGFKDNLESDATRCEFMQSDGGLVGIDRFSGFKAILSGPAGGVVGQARTSYDPDDGRPVIGFDMGGTSTDVSRYGGNFSHSFETITAGVSILAPQLDINTVAAGGGSILHWRHGLFVVGPDSAGAHPGPACYRKGGPLTITDANLFLGRLLPDYFPKIFGKHENEGLDLDIVRTKFAELTEQVNRETGQKKTPAEVAMGFIDVANEAMAKPIRALTEAQGYDTSKHNLASFGGAGGQHACALATSLSIRRVIIHRYSSILSAYGMALADVVHEAQKPASGVFTTAKPLADTISALKKEVDGQLARDGVESHNIDHEVYLNLKYKGTDNTLMVQEPADGDFLAAFERDHQREYSFTFPEKDVLLEDIRVRGIGQSDNVEYAAPQRELASVKAVAIDPAKTRDTTAQVYFDKVGWVAAPVYKLENLAAGSTLEGPAIIIDNTQTILVEPRVKAMALRRHIILDQPTKASQNLTASEIDPIALSIFGHRFMSIAEQMGRSFQKTAVSTNIKERLDFSCAVFSPEGRLVANAPHVPVHLGAMEYAVRYQNDMYRSILKPGDVLSSNHPQAGGVHLPDITIITPVWNKDSTDIIFWVASRGHHPDVGGITPGSMPSNSKFLYEEGAMIMSYKIVSNGIFNEAETRRLMFEEPAKFEGCSGARNYQENLSDLRAAIAANQKGALLIMTLIDEYTLPVVHAYMQAISDNAENAVRAFLRSIAKQRKGVPLAFEDFLDEGTRINLEIRINEDTGDADFDFTGTSEEHFSCMNAPKAITYSCIIYSLRCLINVDIPLNQGCLAPLNVIIPDNTLLNPSKYAAVCAGNGITSQRITDVILGAFAVVAASQGCVNCISFGMGGSDGKGGIVPGFGYIETIAGGNGAGPTWHGASGTHSHMSNTRCADPEVFELRYPVILRRWTLREGSGGRGQFNGGDGCIRELEFRMPLHVSVLMERRVLRPYGMQGGGPGQCGKNLYIRQEHDGGERVINIGGKRELDVHAGDRVIVYTPGGGAWGKPTDGVPIPQAQMPKLANFEPRGSVHEWTLTAQSAI